MKPKPPAPKFHVEHTGNVSGNWHELKFSYGPRFPDALVWLPDTLDSELLEDIVRDAQELQ